MVRCTVADPRRRAMVERRVGVAPFRLRRGRAVGHQAWTSARQAADAGEADGEPGMTRPLRVGISALSLLVPHTGIGSYTRNLGNALRAMAQVQARFFYGYGWSPEVRQAAPTGMASLRT